MRFHAAAGLVLAAAPVSAQVPDCDRAVVQIDLNRCAQSAWEAEDEALNAAYQAAMARARDFDTAPEGRAEATLRAAQRAWIAFRDTACEAEAAAYDGGTIQPMIHSACLARLTAQRAQDLRSYMEP